MRHVLSIFTRRILIFAITQLFCVATLGQDLDCFVDMSGSMEGPKAQSARAGSELLVWMLDDSFCVRIVSFDDRTNTSPDFSIAQQRGEAQQWIRGLRTGGGTDYLGALQAGRKTAERIGIFLSDGVHGGRSEDVTTAVRRDWVGKGTLHTIAVDCPQGSRQEQLLQEMATLTGGTFTRAENSESLVEAFLKIATQLGKYRSWTPQQKTVDLERCNGRVMAFGYDGSPLITGANTHEPARRVHSMLPGEDVFAVIHDLSTPSDIRLQLNPTAPQDAWLGGIYRNDLLVADVRIPTQNSRVPAGQPLKINIDFHNPDGSVSDGSEIVSGTVSLIDARGTVVSSTDANVADDGSRLTAELPMPQRGGDFGIRTETTVHTEDGHGFSSIDEQRILVVAPLTFQVNPRLLKHDGHASAFAMTIAIQPSGSKAGPVDYQAQIKSGNRRLRLVGSQPSGSQLTLDFVVSEPGNYSGVIEVTGSALLPVTTVSVPFEFTIRSRFAGLTVPSVQNMHLGTVLAGSGLALKTLRFASADEDVQTYRVSVSNLSSGTDAIPFRNPDNSFTADINTPGTLPLQYTVGNAVAGTYRSQVQITGIAKNTPATWTVNLTLSVAEPLIVNPVPIVVVPIGNITPVSVNVRNSGKLPATGLSIGAAQTITGTDGGTRQITITSDSQRAGIPPGRTFTFPLKVAVSPLMESPGMYRATAMIRRGSHLALSVPLQIRVVAAEDAPAPFTVSPSAVRQTSAPGTPLRIELSFQATSDLKRPETLSVRVKTFSREGVLVTVVEQHRFATGATLKPRKTMTCELFLIAPAQSGRYRSDVVITTSTGPSITVPFELTVQ